MKSTLWLSSLCLFVASLWCMEMHRLSPASWSEPTQYYGDCYIMLAYIKAVQQGDCGLLGVRTAKRLAAPDTACWANFPMYEKVTTCCLGLLARHTSLMFAANVGVMMARVTAALGFWIASVLILGCSRWWAWVGAVAFSQLNFMERDLNHLLLGYVWSIPLIVAATWVPMRARWLLLIGVAVGISNPYWVLGSLVLLVACDRPLRSRLTLLAGLATGFIGSNLLTILYAHKIDLARNYMESERFALRPMELLLPPVGGLFRNVSKHYTAVLPSWQQGEMFAAYLGIIGTGALGLVLYDWLARQRAGVQFSQVCALMIAGCVGGLTCIMALCGAMMFRGANRLSEFIAAVCLLYFVTRLSGYAKRV